ncbi:glycoside hydrolase family 5 protein [Myxococcota bacterium]
MTQRLTCKRVPAGSGWSALCRVLVAAFAVCGCGDESAEETDGASTSGGGAWSTGSSASARAMTGSGDSSANATGDASGIEKLAAVGNTGTAPASGLVGPAGNPNAAAGATSSGAAVGAGAGVSHSASDAGSTSPGASAAVSVASGERAVSDSNSPASGSSVAAASAAVGGGSITGAQAAPGGGAATGSSPAANSASGGNSSSADNSATGVTPGAAAVDADSSGESGSSAEASATTGSETAADDAASTSEAGSSSEADASDSIPADAQPTPESSGTEGAFRVNVQTGRVVHNGSEFQVRGASWFGLEGQDDLQRPGAMELYIGAVSWADQGNKRTLETTMQEIQTSPLALNTIRLPIAPQCLVPEHPDGDYGRTDVKIRNNDPEYYPYSDCREALEDFLVQADQNNLYVMLDIHSCSNHLGWRAGSLDDAPPYADSERENYEYKKDDHSCASGEDAYDREKWLADVRTLARLPKELGVDNVLGIDCFNEPHVYSWGEWSDLAKDCYDAIAEENDDLIAVVQGVAGSYEDPNSEDRIDQPHGDTSLNPNWGENLYGQQLDPIQIPKDRLCFSPHTYGPSVFVQKQFVDQSSSECEDLEDETAAKAGCGLVIDRDDSEVVAALRRGWEEHFGYLADEGYCLIIGEFGGFKEWPNNPVEPEAADLWAHLPADVRYDWEWQNIFVDYLRDEGITDFVYWSVNPESGDTGGLYQHAFSLSNEAGWGVWDGFDSEKVELLGRL